MTALAKATDHVRRHWACWLGVVALLCAADVAAIAAAYLVYPGYLDHGEPVVAVTAWRLLGGYPIYPPLDGPDFTSNIYGPVTYLVHVLSYLIAGPGIAASKAAGILAAVAIPAVVFQTHRRRGLAWALAAAVLAAGFVVLGLPTSVWNRPDPFLALLVALAAWAANAAPPPRPEGGKPDWLGAAAIGLCGGLAAGFKLHAGLYFVPVVLLYCHGRGLRAFAAICAVGALALALPFAFEPFSLSGFWAWFPLVAGKETVLWPAAKVFRYLAFYGMPLIFFLAALRWADGGVGRAEAVYFGAFAASLAVVLFAALKPGAGWYYFFPFLSVVIDLIVRHAAAVTRHKAAVRGVIAVLAAALLVISIPVQKRFVRALHWDDARQITAEIASIIAAFPGRTIQMGAGETIVGYNKTLYKPLLVFAGHPYTLDVGVAIETSAIGVPLPDAVRARLRDCHTRVWLVPAGETPFALTGYYGNPVFDGPFKEAFRQRYRKQGSFGNFDAWACS